MAILSNLCVMRSPAMAGLILEIFLYIPAVKIFACLDLEQNISFLNWKLSRIYICLWMNINLYSFGNLSLYGLTSGVET